MTAAHREYSEINVPWIGSIPSQWSVEPLFSVAAERREPNIGMRENNLLSLSYGQIVPKDMASNDGLLPQSFETYQVVHEDDIVLRLTDLQNDKRSLRSARVRERGIITSAYLAIRPFGVSPSFLNYLLRSYDQSKVLYSMGGGLRQSMKYSDMKWLPLVLPSLAEQTAIATFLDRETAKIDALVNEQKRLIELLKEKRQAVISHAVTKGLDPNAKMKPSGVEWLGDVPEHWDVVRLRFITTLNPTKSELGEQEDDTEVPFLPMDHIGDDGSIVIGNYRPLSEVRTGYTYFREEDVVIAKIAPCFENGKGAIVRGLAVGFGFGTTELIVVRSRLNCITPDFLGLIFSSTEFRRIGEGQMYGAGGQKRVPDDFVRNFTLGVPPVNEQNDICKKIIIDLYQLDELIGNATHAISLMGERRSALISAAVTGKIDLREWVSDQQTAAE